MQQLVGSILYTALHCSSLGEQVLDKKKQNQGIVDVTCMPCGTFRLCPAGTCGSTTVVPSGTADVVADHQRLYFSSDALRLKY